VTSIQMRILKRTLALLAIVATVGCQQKMADQPAPRAYDSWELGNFAYNQSARPLEFGVVHRGQRSPEDPMINWLTPAGKAPKVSEEWKKTVDPSGSISAPIGAPTDVANFVNEFPFEMTERDLKLGQVRYNTYCALCHGATGNGWGKIVERGFLRPPSYHLDADGKGMDWTSRTSASTELAQGYSRGFFRYAAKVPLEQVPVGYIYQVITWGYGGMPDHASQITPEDRWRIIAYIRALQLSQGAKGAVVTAEMKKALDNPAAAKTDGH
jgi:mono/diheme cytochrome c family protein